MSPLEGVARESVLEQRSVCAALILMLIVLRDPG